jgi:ribose/xylose/arabinose/galactoside ABC-type transport system permease subunit
LPHTVEAGVTYDSPRFRGDASYSGDPADDGFGDSPAFRDSVAYRESVAGGRNTTGLREGSRDEETTVRNTTFTPGSYPLGGYPSTDYGTDNTLGLTEPDAGPEPAPAPARAPKPPRDRIAVHIGWEIVLLLGAGAVAFLLWRADSDALRGAALRGLYLQVAIVGAVAVGTALSLRAAAPNLALGPIAYAAAMFFADNSDRGVLVTAGVTGLLAAAAGITIAIVVTAFHVPSWAASLAGGLGLVVWIQDQRGVEVVARAYDPDDHAVFWFAGFVALSLLGGLLGLVPGLRRATGRYRPTGDPATRGRGAVSAALALIGSSIFAAAGGVLLALSDREIAPSENGLELTALALGAALLGGTSVYGRYGGLFGTALAVILLTLLVEYAAAEDRDVSAYAVAAAAMGVGLLVSRLVEVLGRPRSRPEPAPPAVYEPMPYEPEPAMVDDRWNTSGTPWSGGSSDRSPEDRWDQRWASH